jgi:hypothetical protein
VDTTQGAGVRVLLDELYHAVCAAPDATSARWKGRGWKVIQWLGDGAIGVACSERGVCAIELGDEAIRQQAERFGFNHEFLLPLPATPSVYPTSALSDDQTGLTGVLEYVFPRFEEAAQKAMAEASGASAPGGGGVVVCGLRCRPPLSCPLPH